KRLVGVFRVDRTDEGDVLAVGRPNAAGCLGAEAGQLPGLAAVEGDDPQLSAAAAVGLEQQMLAVGRPARVAVLLAGVRQLARFALAVGRGQPDAGGDAVVLQADRADDVRDKFAVGADLRVADALEAEQVVDLHGALAGGLRRSRGGGRAQHQSENKDEALHGASFTLTERRGRVNLPSLYRGRR